MTEKTETAETAKEQPLTDKSIKDLRGIYNEKSKELIDLLGESYDRSRPNAVINWNKLAKNENASVDEVKERVHALKEQVNDTHDAMTAKFETNDVKNALERLIPEQNRNTPLVSPDLLQGKPKGFLAQAAEREGEEFLRKFEGRKSYEAGVIENFPNTGIGEIMDAVQTTSTTISVNENRDESRVVTYLDPMRTIASRLTRIQPIDGGDTYTYIKEKGAGGWETSDKKSNAIAGTAEAAKYKEQEYDTNNVSVKVEKLTGYSQVSDEQLSDVRVARQFVETRLMTNVEQAVENQVINGNGTAPNWKGLLAQTNLQTQAKVATIKKLDVFIDAVVKLTGTAYVVPDILVMDSATAAIFAKLKDDDGRYLWSNVVEGFPARIFGVPLVISEHMPANTGFMFDISQFALLDKQGMQMQWGFQSDDFIKGIQTVRVSCRGNILAWRENCGVKITGLNVADS